MIINNSSVSVGRKQILVKKKYGYMPAGIYASNLILSNVISMKRFVVKSTNVIMKLF